MFIRITTVRKASKTYQYAQIVESFRRDSDGQPAHRVVAKLGAVSQLLIANLRTAFRAEAAGSAVVLPTVPAPLLSGVRAFRYLDVALCLHFWARLGLGELLNTVAPSDGLDVPVASVVAALVAHRCTDPGSKLSAQAWFPRTALPELLGVSPAQFNNARVHRALTVLENVGPALQAANAVQRAARPGGLKALYLDVTDTWFVGRGPELAKKRKTKEGLWRRKIGIVLLCDSDGHPMRWRVIGGRVADNRAMTELAKDLKGIPWLSEIPVACDRAMGKPRTLRRLADAGVFYVTMLPSDGFAAFTADKIPRGVADHVVLDADDAVEQADAAAERAGMSRARERMRALDLGVRTAVPARPEPRTHRNPPAHAKRLADARVIHAARTAGETKTAAAARLDITPATATRIADLLRLTPDLQAAVEAGRGDLLSLEDLRRISKRPVEEQGKLFEDEVAARRVAPDDDSEDDDDDGAPTTARVIITFNPAAFVTARTSANGMQGRLDAAVAEVNRGLASPRSKRTKDDALVEAHRVLRSFDAEDLYDVVIGERAGAQRVHPVVTMTRHEDVWKARRALDGFGVLVAHPDLVATTDDLVRTYAQKNKIEEDFHVIKSMVDVRPVFHRTDAKVDAHVTVCMLALMVARAIEAAAEREISASRALELLEPVKLLTMRGPPVIHGLSEPSPAESALVQKLGVASLLDTAALAKRMKPVTR
jgi:hypothetical protein